MKNFWLWYSEPVDVPTGWDGEDLEYSPIPRKLLDRLRQFWTVQHALYKVPDGVLVQVMILIDQAEGTWQ